MHYEKGVTTIQPDVIKTLSKSASGNEFTHASKKLSTFTKYAFPKNMIPFLPIGKYVILIIVFHKNEDSKLKYLSQSSLCQ